MLTLTSPLRRLGRPHRTFADALTCHRLPSTEAVGGAMEQFGQEARLHTFEKLEPVLLVARAPASVR